MVLSQADVALYYTADVEYRSGKKATETPLGTFKIWRWALPGMSGSVASTTSGTLDLPIDLSATNCYEDGSGANVKCGDGKYVVTQVTAHRWVASDSTASDANGIEPAATWSAFTIVGELLAGRGGLARAVGGELARPASTSVLTRSMSAVAVPGGSCRLASQAVAAGCRACSELYCCPAALSTPLAAFLQATLPLPRTLKA